LVAQFANILGCHFQKIDGPSKGKTVGSYFLNKEPTARGTETGTSYAVQILNNIGSQTGWGSQKNSRRGTAK